MVNGISGAGASRRYLVGTMEGAREGKDVGADDGVDVGANVGSSVGCCVVYGSCGRGRAISVGKGVGGEDGDGDWVCGEVGHCVGESEVE